MPDLLPGAADTRNLSARWARLHSWSWAPTAAGIAAAGAAGVRVPQDLSVAGFDDIEFAAMVEPSLTTIHQPRRELGRRAALVLLELLTGRPVETRVRLKTDLVVRASTAPTNPSRSERTA